MMKGFLKAFYVEHAGEGAMPRGLSTGQRDVRSCCSVVFGRPDVKHAAFSIVKPNMGINRVRWRFT
jgi:hypothetical protein